MNVLTIAEVAAHLRVSDRTVKREIAAGELKAIRIRGCIRIAPSDLDTYLHKRRITPSCPSDVTAKAGRRVSGTLGVRLKELLGPGRTRSSSSVVSVRDSKIVALDDHRSTRLRKRSSGG